MYEQMLADDCQRLVGVYEQAWNRRDPVTLAELYAEDAIAILGEKMACGRAQIRALYEMLAFNPREMYPMSVDGMGFGDASLELDGTIHFAFYLVARYVTPDFEVLQARTEYRLRRNLKNVLDRMLIEREMALEYPD